MLDKVVKNKIENVYGHKIRYPRDCDGLAADIFSKSGYRLSSSTIKRLFGFIETKSKPNQYTLDSIAIYLGYESWLEVNSKSDFDLEQFEQDFKQKEIPKSKRKLKLWGLTSIFITMVIAGSFLIKNNFEKKPVKFVKLKNLPEPRAGGKTILLDSNIYYIGGSKYGLMCNNTWAYNFYANSWKKLSPMPTKRAEMATAIVDNKIYCFGGWLGNTIGMSDIVEVYDLKKNKWDSLPKLPLKITSANAVTSGKNIYILGGTTGETNMFFFKFNTLTMGYESLPLLNMNVLYHCMVLEQNKIYIIGGQSYFNFKYSWQKNVYVFDIAKNKWSIKTPIPMPISGGEAFVLNNKIHVIGGKDTYGNDNSGLKDSHYVYDIKKNVWDIAEKIPYRVFGHQLVHVNGKNILIGGVTNSPNPTNKVISF